MIELKNNERGFVLAEFVIALPLLIFLLYTLTQTTLKISQLAREQIADYVLESEMQDMLKRISNDARAAVKIEIHKNYTSSELDAIVFKEFGTIGNGGTLSVVRDVRRYVVDFTESNKNHFVVKRLVTNTNFTTPVTGDNFFGDTKVTYLKFEMIREKVLHISLEMQSQVTKKKIKINTAVFMPALEELEIKFLQ